MKAASNREITLLRKLKQRKHRQKEQLFIVEGERAVQQVLQNGFTEVWDVFLSDDSDQEITVQIEGAKRLSQELFKEVSDTESPQGILAVCKIPEEIELEAWYDKQGLLVAFDRIQDPGNLGTMLRTAAWFGATGLLLGKGTVDLFNPKVVRSTAGAVGSLPWTTGELTDILHHLESSGWQTLLLDGNPGAKKLESVQPDKKNIVVIGNEARGINPELIVPQRKRVMIPPGKAGSGVESLNASVALSIALYHLRTLANN